jgi:hypothetical protein
MATLATLTMMNKTAPPDQLTEPHVITDKLSTFEYLSKDFQTSFAYVQNVQGQRRFSSFSIASTVRYLHALWICECKDLLLSVPRTTSSRYQGRRALTLLRRWQQGEIGDVVAFLEDKLALVPFADITNRVQAAGRSRDETLQRRLAHGRWVLLNRAWNREHALEVIFMFSPEALKQQVRAACAQYGHRVDEIEAQLARLHTPLYACIRHPALAQRNMVLMNALGVRVTDNIADRPGQRTDRIQPSKLPYQPYAEQVIDGATTLVSKWSNNPALLYLSSLSSEPTEPLIPSSERS